MTTITTVTTITITVIRISIITMIITIVRVMIAIIVVIIVLICTVGIEYRYRHEQSSQVKIGDDKSTRYCIKSSNMFKGYFG